MEHTQNDPFQFIFDDADAKQGAPAAAPAKKREYRPHRPKAMDLQTALVAFNNTGEKETPHNSSLASSASASHDSDFRPRRELTANWYDEIAAVQTDTPLSPLVTHVEKTASVAHYWVTRGAWHLGDVWFKLPTVGGAIEKDNAPYILWANYPRVILVKNARIYGYSTKVSASKPADLNVAGMFGEGLKLAGLNALRYKWNLKIRAGNKLMRYSFEADSKDKDEEFEGCLTLCLHNAPQQSQVKGTLIMLSPQSPKDTLFPHSWSDFEMDFLPLMQKESMGKTTETTLTTGGRLKLFFDPKFKGRIYVKGHYVSTNDDLNVGIESTDLDVVTTRDDVRSDRELYRAVSAGWVAASMADDEIAKKWFEIFINRPLSIDTKDISAVTVQLANKFAALFVEKYGMDAEPVLRGFDTAHHTFLLTQALRKAPVCITTQNLYSILKRSTMFSNLTARVNEAHDNLRKSARVDEATTPLKGVTNALIAACVAASPNSVAPLIFIFNHQSESYTPARASIAKGPPTCLAVNYDQLIDQDAKASKSAQKQMLYALADIYFQICKIFIDADIAPGKFFASFYETMFPEVGAPRPHTPRVEEKSPVPAVQPPPAYAPAVPPVAPQPAIVVAVAPAPAVALAVRPPAELRPPQNPRPGTEESSEDLDDEDSDDEDDDEDFDAPEEDEQANSNNNSNSSTNKRKRHEALQDALMDMSLISKITVRAAKRIKKYM